MTILEALKDPNLNIELTNDENGHCLYIGRISGDYFVKNLRGELLYQGSSEEEAVKKLLEE